MGTLYSTTNDELRTIAKGITEFIILAILVSIPAILAHVDIILFGTIEEFSATEISQLILLLITIIILGSVAKSNSDKRGMSVLIAGFLPVPLFAKWTDSWI